MNVTRSSNTKPATRLKPRPLVLHPATIEKVFTDCVWIKEVVVLDGTDILPDESGFRIRCHDLHGPLPEIVAKDSGDTFQDKDRLSKEACKLIAIVGLREGMIRCMAGGRFLPPTIMDGRAIVGMMKGRKTWMAEGKDFSAAYHELHEKVLARAQSSLDFHGTGNG